MHICYIVWNLEVKFHLGENYSGTNSLDTVSLIVSL